MLLRCRILPCHCRPGQLVLESFHRRSKCCPVALLHRFTGLIELHSCLRQGRRGGGRRLGRSLLRGFHGLLRPEKVGDRLVERGLHYNFVGRYRDDALQLRKVRAGGLQVQRHDVEERVLDRSNDQPFPRMTLDPLWSQSVSCWEMVGFWSIIASIWFGP